MKAARKGQSLKILFTATRDFVMVLRVITVVVLSIFTFGLFINWVYESGYYLPDFGFGLFYCLYLVPPGGVFWVVLKIPSDIYFGYLLKKGIDTMPSSPNECSAV